MTQPGGLEGVKKLLGRLVIVRWLDAVSCSSFEPQAAEIEKKLRAFSGQVNLGKLVEVGKDDIVILHHWDGKDYDAAAFLIPRGCLISVCEVREVGAKR